MERQLLRINFVLSQKTKGYALLLIEGIILILIIFAFWHHTPPIRENWLWLLWLAVPIFAIRLAIHERIWVNSPLNFLLVAFIVLTAFNFSNAPFHRESYLAVVGRPLLGIWLYLYFLELAKVSKSLTPLLIITIGMTFVLGSIALTTTQWLPEKLGNLTFLAEALPDFNYKIAADNLDGRACIPFSAMIISEGCFNPSDIMRNTYLSFNPNEIAGALAWITPIMAAIALGYPSSTLKDEKRDWQNISLRIAAAIVFIMLFVALFLGQSRFAIAGVLISLVALVWIFIPNGVWRYLALAIIAFFVLIQLGLFLSLFSPNNSSTSNNSVGVSNRDQNSVETRLQIWNRGLRMMFDYPLTGTGMAMYRTVVNRPPYEIPYYVENDLYPPPHAHNEWIQMGADLGIPGFVLYISWQIVILQMLWYGWRSQNKAIQVTAIASFAGLFAHAVYGFGDAVTLWDRYQFILWWLVGLAGAQFVLAKSEIAEKPHNSNNI